MESSTLTQRHGNAPTAMMVFANHLYEYKKGIRRMVLFTVHHRYVESITCRLDHERICYNLQDVGNGRTNIFFGRPECIRVIRKMITLPLHQLSPEQDFILGTLLGYDICVQCERFCKRAESDK